MNASKSRVSLSQDGVVNKDQEIVKLQQELDTRDSQLMTAHENLVIMKQLMEEMAATFLHEIKEAERDKEELTVKCSALITERDQLVEDTQSIEESFSTLLSRYEKMKQALELCRQTEDEARQRADALEDQLKDTESKYEIMRAQAQEKVEE